MINNEHYQTERAIRQNINLKIQKTSEFLKKGSLLRVVLLLIE